MKEPDSSHSTSGLQQTNQQQEKTTNGLTPGASLFTSAVMGNSASTGLITSAPKKMPWGPQKEDTMKLEDFLTQSEEDLWKVNRKRGVSVKKIHLNRSIHYMDLAVHEKDFYPDKNNIINPAFEDKSL